jgi:hypothetical protein
VTVSPAVAGGRLGAGIQQFAVQVSVPSETGRWKGSALLLWDKPTPGRMELPILVTTRNQPTLALATPQQLSFAAATGGSLQFRFQLKETAKGSPATGVKVLATDLRGTAGTKLLRAEKVNAALQSDVLAGGGLMPVSVTIDLRDVQSGKYTGQLMVTDAYYNDITVPLEVSVKDRWPLPLAVLLFGVLAGMTISGYRARGRTRDELVVRIDSINTQVADSGRLQEALKPLVQRTLTEVSSHIESKKWDAAKEAAGRAEALILRWRSDEDAWFKALERMKGLHSKLDALADSTLRQQLSRQLERMDLAALTSARALADEVDKIEDSIKFFEHVQNLLSEIKSDIDALSSPKVKRELSEELAPLQTKLLELKAEDKQSAETLLSSARTLVQKASAARQKEEALQQEIQALTTGADEIIRELAKPAASKAARSMAELARRMLAASAEQETLEARRQRVEHIWRGLWSAQTMLQLVAREPKSPEDKALFDWLSDERHYRQSTDQFRASLEALEAHLPDTSWPDGIRPTVPPPPPARQMRGKGALLDEAVARPVFSLAAAAIDDRVALAAGRRSGVFRSMLMRLYPSAEAERSRMRLTLFRYSTYALALGLLVWMGFTELYAASATFGADGTKDYLVLFLWGFGAEATRSAVTEVVKGLVPAN